MVEVVRVDGTEAPSPLFVCAVTTTRHLPFMYLWTDRRYYLIDRSRFFVRTLFKRVLCHVLLALSLIVIRLFIYVLIALVRVPRDGILYETFISEKVN